MSKRGENWETAFSRWWTHTGQVRACKVDPVPNGPAPYQIFKAIYQNAWLDRGKRDRARKEIR